MTNAELEQWFLNLAQGIIAEADGPILASEVVAIGQRYVMDLWFDARFEQIIGTRPYGSDDHRTP